MRAPLGELVRHAFPSVLATLLAAVPARAGTKVEVRGWTADGRHFALVVTTDFKESDCRTGSRVARVLDSTARSEETYELSRTGCEDGRQETKNFTEREQEFSAWLKAHPVKAPLPSKLSPDKKSLVEIALEGNKGHWQGDLWGYDGKQVKSPETGEPEWQSGTLTCSIIRSGRARGVGVGTWKGQGGLVRPFWAPDSKAVAFVNEQEPADEFAEPPSVEVVTGLADAPVVEVTADRGLKGAAPKVVEALRKAGVFPVKVGFAAKPRAKSVVLAAPGFEEQARAAAGAVPGGAEVEELAGKADADVLVVLGASAK